MDSFATGSGMPPIPASYYENFLESLAQLVSKLLTDQETEKVISSIRSFQEKLKRLSSQNLSRLNIEISASEKARPNLCRHEGKSCTQNCTRGFIKTFTVAFAVKYLIGILPTLLTGNIFKRPGILKQMAGRDTAGFALFLSTFTSSYKGILCAMRHFRKTSDPKSDKLNAFVAGTVAGLSLIFDRNASRRQSLMLYLLTRALQFNGAWLMKQWAKKRREEHPGELKWDDHFAKFLSKYAGVGVMMIAGAQLMYSFIMSSDTVSRSYYAFLLTQANFKNNYGRMASNVADTLGTATTHLVQDKSPIKIPAGVSSRDFIAQHISPNIASAIPPRMRHEHILCALQHPLNDSCSGDKVTLFKNQFIRSLKMYVPLNVIMLVVLRSKQLAKKPKTVLQKFAISCLRSAFFLTMYVTMGIASICWMRRLTGVESPYFYAVAGAVGGSMVIIEAPSRQLELALYCLPRAFEALWNTGVKNGTLKNIPHGDVLLFMASMGSLMTLYQNEKDTINSHYLSVMTRFFGEN
ncbi:hypothetical protein HPULCUR_010943 [Helicostylum pulchrum]|uniref:Transmembrane protein 135 N-terminal domain-containing protein n=1 Tax=Helicostylum pulchrum TaxID=562976 RepID=A0ABP9YEP7_9FUNG